MTEEGARRKGTIPPLLAGPALGRRVDGPAGVRSPGPVCGRCGNDHIRGCCHEWDNPARPDHGQRLTIEWTAQLGGKTDTTGTALHASCLGDDERLLVAGTIGVVAAIRGAVQPRQVPVRHHDVAAGEGQMTGRIVPVVDNVERRALPPQVSGRCQPLAPC